MTQQLTSSPRKKLLDEGAFQELLAAAFVLQKHNELDSNPTANSIEVLSEIVRIQRLIRTGNSNLLETAKFISEQVQKFTRADGVTIGILTGDELIYLSAVGMAAHEIGRRIPRDSSLSEKCIHTGLTFETLNTDDDRRMFSSNGHAEVKSFIAVPVEFDRRIVGVLEARFKTANAFTAGDVHNCELMAALVKELISRAGQSHTTTTASTPATQSQSASPAEATFDESSDQTAALPQNAFRVESDASPELLGSFTEEAIEATETEIEQPEAGRPEAGYLEIQEGSGQLPTVASDLAADHFTEAQLKPASQTKQMHDAAVDAPQAKSKIDSAVPQAAVCRGCGQRLAEEEKFCGRCGMKRSIHADGPLQSKWASLWYMNQARQTTKTEESLLLSLEPLQEAHPVSSPENLLEKDLGDEKEALTFKHSPVLDEHQLPVLDEHQLLEEDENAGATLIEESQETDAANQLLRVEWLPTVAGAKPETWLLHQWRVNRANFYLAGASLLLIFALSGWSTAPMPVPRPAGPRLSLFERALVGLGLAETTQPTVVNLGNPDTPVWVDLHTALYYCPGSELYGRTEGGKIATQRSAQMDQFEPAHRKACN